MPDLFDHALQERMKSETPLATRMRPRTFYFNCSIPQKLTQAVRFQYVFNCGLKLRYHRLPPD